MAIKTFLFFFLPQALSMTLWYERDLTGLGSRQFWVLYFLLAAISFVWPIYQRYASPGKIRIPAMIGYFFAGLLGIIMANVLWFACLYLSAGRSHTMTDWKEALAGIALLLIFQVSTFMLFYLPSMFLFSWIIVGGLRHLRQARQGDAESLEN